MARVVLVTGVARYLGGRFARMLAAHPGVERVVGVDVEHPPHDLGTAEFVRADIRSPVIARVLARAKVDTVVQMNLGATPAAAGGRLSMKETNVIGTMQLLAACQQEPTVRHLVVRSTAAVYGSSPRDPAMFTEDCGPQVLPRTGWAKDSAEVEGYVRGFSRRRPDVRVVILRLADVVGPGARHALTDYFSLPVVPVLLGFDPRLQLVHEDDSIEALRLATMGSCAGAVNVGGDGVLTVHQAAHLAGRPTVPVPGPMAAWMRGLLRQLGLADLTADQTDLLFHGRVLDTTRMRADLALEPRFTTREAFEDFVRARGLRGPLSRDVVAAAEDTVVAAQRLGCTTARRLVGPERQRGHG